LRSPVLAEHYQAAGTGLQWQALLLAQEVDRERGIILAEKRTRDSAASRVAKEQMQFDFAGTLVAEREPIGIEAVLNAADPMVARMADSCPGSVTFFTSDRNHPVMAMHRAQRKRVVYRDGDSIVASGGGVEHRIALAGIPVTQQGAIGFQIENAMAATAAAWALGLDWPTIERGLGSFVNDARTAPGRFNVFHYRGATLIADYGHNPDAIQALVDAIDNLPLAAGGKRSVVISGAGDRRDEDIRQQTEILGDAFDRVLLYQDQCQRGRADGEVLALLREGLRNARRTSEVEEIRGEFLAIDMALAKLQSGDLCLILIDQIEEALEHIHQRLAEG